MPFVHLCPKHGPEPCPAMPYGHACRDDSTLTFDGPIIPVAIPLEVG